MFVVNVNVLVKPEYVEKFKTATSVNAGPSGREPGIARFDVLQHENDPTRFLLVEVYRSAEAPAAHKETEHYRTWKDTVEPMMAEPRTSVKFESLFPPDSGW